MIPGVNVHAHLWQVTDVHLHVAALAGAVQPLHVHVQRPAHSGTPHTSCSQMSAKLVLIFR